eukprot:c12585_g1_i1 orf=146-403(+)
MACMGQGSVDNDYPAPGVGSLIRLRRVLHYLESFLSMASYLGGGVDVPQFCQLLRIIQTERLLGLKGTSHMIADIEARLQGDQAA